MGRCRVLAIAVVALGLLGACGSDAARPEAGPLAFSAPVVGSADLLEGSSLAGAPVALWFWAPT